MVVVVVESSQFPEKGAQTETLRPDIFWWGGGSSRVKGWGPKSSVCSLKLRKQTFGGISWDFCLDIPESLEKSEKNSWFSTL